MSAVTHSGIISKIGTDEVEVTIRSFSACLYCQLHKDCTMTDCRLKTIHISTDEPAIYHIGQAVTVSMDSRLGWLAVFLGYILPLILVISSLIITLWLSGSETLAAILSLAVLAPYYLLLALFKKHVIKNDSFRISAE